MPVPIVAEPVCLRILVTRPQPQADAWTRHLRAGGFDAVALPLLAIDALPDTQALAATWHSLARFALVVFVSPNAVSHFFAARPPGVTWPATTRAAAPGPGTVDALLAEGLAAVSCIGPARDARQFDSAALWAQLEHESWAGQRALLVRGDGGREELADRLRAAGAKVDVVQAYRRRGAQLSAAEQALLDAARASPAAHLWLLSSSEALGTLECLAPGADWSRAQAVATHPRIAAAAERLGFGNVECVAPTQEALHGALERAAQRCIQSMRS